MSKILKKIRIFAILMAIVLVFSMIWSPKHAYVEELEMTSELLSTINLTEDSSPFTLCGRFGWNPGIYVLVRAPNV